ncbi:penicillin-binding protein PBP2X [Streptococcus ovis]|uniref:penicillin-binding protein PBP2X n=1 Tax=Streptococcus ovis TaxID=82806 RepID=UPI0004775D85|nr:penicillin-binding protein PBP2X [Streptococcus ovis]
MASRKNKFLRYVLKNRRLPHQNRRRVGQSLILLSVFTFFVFLINFAIIIGTDSKFGQDLSEGARRVHQTTMTVQAKRGTIYDRTGIAIAQDSTTYTIYAIIDQNYVSESNEKLYVEPSQFGQLTDILKKKLDVDKEFAQKQLSQKNLYQVYFGPKGKNISYSDMMALQEEMKKAGIKGIGFDTQPGRMYPNGNFASYFIGLAQLTDNQDGSQSLHGQTGVEAALNTILSGQDGKITYEKDSYGRLVPGTEKVEKKVLDGQDVYTTISAQLQSSLETNMDIFFSEKTKGKFANASLVSAKTGEILATTQRPSFDADTKEGLQDKNFNWSTSLFQGNFEPGSTMKVMTLASSIDMGIFQPNEYYTNSTYTIADAKFNDWSVNAGRDPQTMTFANGFAFSSNIGMAMLQKKMGDETWLNYLSKFRFGYPTRFGMSSESSGLFPADNIVSIAQSSFGQGISVTNVQMLRAFSAIGNKGAMLEPKFISAIYDAQNHAARISKPEVVGHPVSAEAADETLKYMITVGTDPYYGTLYAKDVGPVIQVDGYDIAVKSGTAEIAKEDGTGYKEGANATINSVVAMIPAEDPEFIMYVTVQEPESWSVLYWQDIINPVLKEAMLLKDSLNLTEPSKDLVTVDTEIPYALGNVVGENPGDTADGLRRQLVQPVIVGNGDKIKKVSVEKGSNIEANQQILLLTNQLTEVPDMYGWTKANTDKFSHWTGIDITYKGEGDKVVAQSVDTGSSMEKTKKITITLGE